uniref:Uncharacterized protein n=1 Tax=Globodera rostochiensis TaxID=31243 RepID=A0A914H2Q8_GLORO
MKPISLGQQSNGKPNSTAVRPPNWPKKSEIVSVDFGAVPFWRPWSLSSRLQISILAKLSTQPTAVVKKIGRSMDSCALGGLSPSSSPSSPQAQCFIDP